MKIAYKHQAIERNNSDACLVTEYPSIDSTMDFAIVKLSGRYPEKRYAVNDKCKEIVYIHEGNGKVVIKDKEHSLNAGDVILIEAGEKFYWEGQMQLFISCRPAFTVEQHQLVD